MGGVKEVNKPLSSNSVMTGEYKWDMNPGGYFIVEWDESNEFNPKYPLFLGISNNHQPLHFFRK